MKADGQKVDYETDKKSWNFLMPDTTKTVIFHNAKFDFGVLHRAGLQVPRLFEDTLIAAHLLDENSEHGLKPLSKKHLGINEPLTFGEADKMRLLNPEVFAQYARNDSRYTFRLWDKFRTELFPAGQKSLQIARIFIVGKEFMAERINTYSIRGGDGINLTVF